MSRKSLLAIASIAGASVLALGALFATKTNSPFFVSGGGAVEHSIVFGNQDISVYDDPGTGYITAELSKQTDAGNDFASSELIIQDYSDDGPVRGDTGDDFIVLIHNWNWPYFADSSSNVFDIFFEMNVDVASGVSAFVTYTTHYNNAGSQSTSTKNADFDIVTEDDLEYLLEYTYAFNNKYYDYVTIDSITIEYSCTY